ncbi:MAG TPA: CGNR zinc finger domain-containing protein [Solirubrobacteraceae bacterium]|jgi:predicted RNA-binding Zn ribbon-like protein|nr:CGNR zinc finger domain-containing protein [Solirubrobacteraceae bacterium]
MVSASQPKIPHSLDLVIDYVNTLDSDEPVDAFATPEGLASWLEQRGLLSESKLALDEADRRRAVRLREALLALMLAHNGIAADDGAARGLDEVARRGELSVCFNSDGSAPLTARASGLDGALAQVLAPVAEAARDGSWERVKACRADDCQWAFYDRSRNRSGVWCDMAVCGNRAKVRAYRSRGAREGG